MTVYVVLRYETEWQELIGVCSTPELAEEMKKKYDDHRFSDWCHVEVIEVDKENPELLPRKP